MTRTADDAFAARDLVNVERIIGKLGVSNRIQIAVRAIELGLISSNGKQPAS